MTQSTSLLSSVRSHGLASIINTWRRVAGQSRARKVVGVTKRLLLDQGYFDSLRAGAPVDGDGIPVPWYTYPAIEYLGSLDFAGRRVFEFGSGNSTRWWEQRASELVSVETDPDWYELVAPQLDPATTKLKLCHDQDEYLAEIAQHDPFDVVVVDGLWRKPSARVALEHLAPGGMIVLDNADWFPYWHALLRDTGMIPIDFHGAGPLGRYSWTTSVFLDPKADFWSGTAGPRPIGGIVPPEMIAVDRED